jgi:hypothetical protein
MPCFYKFTILSLCCFCCPSDGPAAAAIPTAAAASIAAIAAVCIPALLLPLLLPRAVLPYEQQAASKNRCGGAHVQATLEFQFLGLLLTLIRHVSRSYVWAKAKRCLEPMLLFSSAYLPKP